MRDATLGTLLGLNNRLQPTELATKLPGGADATYLYVADNVDLTGKGRVKRRRGTTTRIGAAAHSIWSDPPFREAYAVIADNLERLTEGAASIARTVVRPNMPRLPVSYSRGADGAVYWSNGATLRRILAGQDRPAVTDAPTSVPAVSVGAGALRAGRYLVAFTRTGPDGESPATPIVQLDVPDGGSITWSAAETVNVFTSAPNGEILTLQGAGASGAVVVHGDGGRTCDTLNTAPMPPGTIVRHFSGRMLVASGSLLFYSLPYHYGVCDPVAGYIPLPADISIVEVVEGGVFIAADQTYAIADVAEGQLRTVLPYGAIPGTGGTSPRTKQVFWQSEHGLVLGNADLSASNVQEDALEVPTAASGASLYRERDGMRQIVATRSGVETTVATASTWMDAEVIRKGSTP